MRLLRLNLPTVRSESSLAASQSGSEGLLLRDFEWTWIELAEFLANGWPWLTLEENFPLGIRGGTLDEVHAELARLWDSKSEAVREEEQEWVYNYRESHDLANGVQGAVLPSIWLVKQGLYVWLCSDRVSLTHDAASVWALLEKFVETVVRRALGADDERAHKLNSAWAQRSAVSESAALQIATGLDAETLAAVEGGVDSSIFWGVDFEGLNRSELVAAARMSAVLPVKDIRTIVDAIRATGSSSLDKLDATSASAQASLSPGTPFDQGYAAASWLRRELGLDEDQRIDPADMYDEWGIRVDALVLSTSIVDALACWGPAHGPAVYLNKIGRFARSSAGRRSTLAHEICHLLLDRSGALPLVEVLGGRAPTRIEERARAFAAELLAPREYVGHEFDVGQDPRLILQRVTRRFMVGNELVAWQARNSTTVLTPQVRAFLRTQVSQPSRF
jgi:Zn-dependent peptidase ImmA (M78 family)